MWKVYVQSASRPPAKHAIFCALFKNTQNVRNMHLCSFRVPNLIKMGGQHISGYLFLTYWKTWTKP